MNNFIVSNELKRFLGYHQNKDISEEYSYQMFVNSLKKYFTNMINKTEKIIELNDNIKLLLRMNIKSDTEKTITVEEFVKTTIKYHVFLDSYKSDNLTYYIDKQIPNYITFFTL